ncbi:hypothetical protein [Jiella sp. M17.18]|uniref:hypothetical protein n=1 Tax=Jiella sp. M17.18 TaxID=3234247 RepID=UPI0034DF6FBF
MLIETVLLASSLAIPFGDKPAHDKVEQHKQLPRFETSFEFAEIAGGYLLNAVVIDLLTDARTSVPISKCRTIDIQSFQENLFGTPVVCNGVTYTFDVRKGGIIVAPSHKRLRPKLVKHLMPGHAIVDGMPLFIKANR